jgi:hypothetical protein
VSKSHIVFSKEVGKKGWYSPFRMIIPRPSIVSSAKGLQQVSHPKNIDYPFHVVGEK